MAALAGCATSQAETAAVTAEAAVAAVVRRHPDLAGWGSTSLPPRSVETAARPGGGWFVGFIGRGSGRPGVLEGRCYRVDASGRVASTGRFEGGERVVERIDITRCRPG
jgi:hypothetical protein